MRREGSFFCPAFARMLVRTLVLQPERPISSEWFVWFLEANGIHGKEGRGVYISLKALKKTLLWF
jgi:hypothetical protein